MAEENAGNSFKKIKQKKIVDQVFDQLLAQIKSNRWVVGSKLPSENALAENLGVSRISIREAMKKLGALGIVEARQGEGSYIKEITSSSYKNMMFPIFMLNSNTVTEVLEYREIMEVGCMALAFDRFTQEQIDTLEQILIRMEKNVDDEKSFAKDDLEFHMMIARATNNVLLINVSTFLFDLLAVSMEKIVMSLGMQDGKYYHRLIFDAIVEKDKEKAVAYMQEHVARTVYRVSGKKE